MAGFISKLQLDGLIVRLFEHFLNFAELNSSAVVLEMEKFMTMMIDDSESLNLELLDLLVASVRNDKKITSPVSWQLGVNIFNNCPAKLKPHYPHTVKETSLYTTEIINFEKVTVHKIKLECQEVRSNYLGIRFDDLSIPSVPITQWSGKRKRNLSRQKEQEKVFGSESGIKCIEGYNVECSIAPILRAIFSKHGDIAANCSLQAPSMRALYLTVVCKIVRRIQNNDAIEIEEIESELSDAEAANINVSWIRAHLDATNKRKKAIEESVLVMETMKNIIRVKGGAKMDLKETQMELMAAQLDLRKAEENLSKAQGRVKILDQNFKKDKGCVEILDLVQNKLNGNRVQVKDAKPIL
ncbi:uncharacterized protein [Rutidosis leptorrhynchoides]|uniref:uncharacterized protein n=1 Tax=Rutidosis leptorrhynchoides TaxID=125765 RepID=UPI003A991936